MGYITLTYEQIDTLFTEIWEEQVVRLQEIGEDIEVSSVSGDSFESFTMTKDGEIK